MRDMPRNMKDSRVTLRTLASAAIAVLFTVVLALAGMCFAHAESGIDTHDAGELTLTETSFDCMGGTTTGGRLWALTLRDPVDNSQSQTTTLVDKAIYLDPELGVVHGKENDAYARYSGALLELNLNPDYIVADSLSIGDLERAGVKVSDPVTYIEGSSEPITPTGTRGSIANVRTVVTLSFSGSSYSVNDFSCANFEAKDNVITLTKHWHIVNVANMLRFTDDKEYAEIESSIVYGDNVIKNKTEEEEGVMFDSPRPEHGDTVIWSLARNGSVAERFAVVFDKDGKERLYEANTAGTDLEKTILGTDPDSGEEEYELHPLGGSFRDRLTGLDAGEYVLSGYVPEHQAPGLHTHWWDSTGAGNNDYGVYYGAVAHEFKFTVAPFDVSEPEQEAEALKRITVDRYFAQYTGSPIEPNDIVVRFDGEPLRLAIDYDLAFTDNVNAGIMGVTIIGKNNFTGSVATRQCIITNSLNGWTQTPHINRWVYGTYNRAVNSISAVPTFMDDAASVQFTVLKKNGDEFEQMDGLTDFVLVYDEESGDMLVSEAVAEKLAALDAGTYSLRAYLEDTSSYGELDTSVEFKILQADNRWTLDPSVIEWASDAFDENVKHFIAVPLFGNESDVIIKIKNAAGNTVYDSSVDGLDVLKSLKKGKYTMTATLGETDNYKGLDKSIEFEVLRGSTEIIIAIVIISVFDLLLIAGLVVLFMLARRRRSK